MSIEANATFLNRLEERLSDKLTVANMADVSSAISDILYDFTLTINPKDRPDGSDDLMDAYLSALKVQGRSPKTIERYRYVIGRLMKSVNVPTRQVTVYHLRKYLSEEKENGMQDSTLEGLRQVFSAYFNWLQRENLISQNPTANLGAIKCQKKLKKTYSQADIEKLKEMCNNVRDKAIVCFLLNTGCRINEVVQLDRDAVDIQNMECEVLGKGDKWRTVYFDDVTAMFLRQYFESRDDDNPALFVSKKTRKRIAAGGIRNMLKKIGDLAEVEKVHPHKFRRTLATDLSAHGMPIQEVANILGHEKIDTTMKYVVLNKNAVKTSYNKYR